MESDDDFYSSSPLKESSPPIQLRKLKRLKKTIRVSNDHQVKSVNDPLSLPSVDFAKIVELESSKSLGIDDLSEELQLQSPSEDFVGENDSGFDEDRKETKRALEFDDVDDEFEGKIVDRSVEMEEEMADLETDETIRVSNVNKVKSVSDLLSLPPVDFAKLEELESSKSLGTEDSNDELQSQLPSEGFDSENRRLDSGFDEDQKETRRALEFGNVEDDFEGKGVDPSVEMEEEMADLETDKSFKKLSFEDRSKGVEEEVTDLEGDKVDKKGINEGVLDNEIDGEGVDQSEGMEEEMMDLKNGKSDKKRTNEGGLNEKKEKKKRAKSVRDDAKPKASSSNKRREEKERKATLQQLHAESQRLLRETRDAAFKPIPVTQKPISSILEKIRKRKLEVSKKTASMAESSDCALREVIMDHISENVSIEERAVDKLAKVLEVETVAEGEDVSSGLQTSHVDAHKESGTESIHEKASSPIAPDEEITPAFRVPLDDTQDLFMDSQTGDRKDELPSDQQEDPTEEVLAPSLLRMNLKIDSAPLDDMSSDEEDSDKENIEPHPHEVENGRSSPKGDPVKAFVDDEAVEEDDSDNDLFRFQENEDDEGFEDSEALNDMIATGYEEKPIDNDKRNELHQKWLEQQDAAGTDNLLQRLNYGSKFRDENLLDKEEGDGDADEEELSNEAEAVAPRKLARINSRKAKELIAQMFLDKDDAFLSDDEEAEKKKQETEKKQRFLLEKEEKAALLSPAEDEDSREVFGLIKKLNIVSDTKKKSKASSFFDKLLTGGNSNSSSRSSFLGRASNHSLASSRKKGSSTNRSFIFGRDDSNSRSSISTTEDSLQTISKESQQTRSTTTKFSNSQAKLSTQSKRNVTTEAASGTSLFEILKRSSSQSSFCKQDSNNNMVGLTQFAAFKLPKKPVKMEGRT